MLGQALVIVMLALTIAVIGMKLSFQGRFSQAREFRREQARSLLDRARAETFACLQSAPPYPSPAEGCKLSPDQKACLPKKAGDSELTIKLRAESGRCVLRLTIDN